jgi:O-antigen ligase
MNIGNTLHFNSKEINKIFIFLLIVLISIIVKSAILSFILFGFLALLDKRFIISILLITPVIETILIATDGLTVTKLLAAFFALYFLISLALQKSFLIDENIKLVLLFLMVAISGMFLGFLKLNPTEIIESLNYNLIAVFPKILMALLIYQYFKYNNFNVFLSSLKLSIPTISISLICISIYFIFFSSSEHAWFTHIIRLTFEGTDPNEFAGVFAALGAFPLAMVLLRTNFILRIISIISIGLIIYAVTLTLSRGGILTLIFLLVLTFTIFSKGSISKILFYLIFILIGIGGMIYIDIIHIENIQERFIGARIQDASSFTEGRSEIFISAINGVIKRPFFGYGNFPGTAIMVTESQLGEGFSIHNIFLEILIRFGIVGFFVFICILFRTSRGLQFFFKYQQENNSNNILIIPIICIWVVLFSGLALSWQWKDILWYLIGLSLTASHLIIKNSQTT